MNVIQNRARLLFEQGRYDLAIEQLRHELTDHPDSPAAHALLALCLSKQRRHAEAVYEAQTAVHLAPDTGYYHSVLGSVLDDVRRFREAEAAAREAIRLSPDEARYFALLASILFQQQQWAPALTEAERGLALDPDHVGCANLRAMALVQLGRREEAGSVIASTLAQDPENAFTHANQGWALLHGGKHQAALEHFREALRLNPQLDWARKGILEAMRARNPVYRMMLAYFLWMSRLGKQARWGFVIGLYVGVRVLAAVGRENPSLLPWVYPVVGLYLIFVFLSWTAVPLSNLLLRLDPFGRYALSPRQIIASNWVGSCLALATACLAVGIAAHSEGGYLMAAMFALLMIPTAASFRGSSPAACRLIGALTVLLALVVGCGATIEAWNASPAFGIAVAILLVVVLAANGAAAVRAALRPDYHR